jgi:hypothetical protein
MAAPMAAPAASSGGLSQLAGETSAPEAAGEPATPDGATDAARFSDAIPRTNLPFLLGASALLALGLGLGAARLVVRRRRGNHPRNRPV